MDIGDKEDPRAKSNRYSKGARAKFEMNNFEFANTQFLIDDNYVGVPPSVQVGIENLNDNIDENFLRKDLNKWGKIRTLEIVRNPETGQHLGLAKVQFELVSDAQLCVVELNKKVLMGRHLNVYKDLRFAKIEKAKEEKLNPKPIIAQTMQQKQLTPTLISSSLPIPALPTPSVVLQNSNLPPHMLPPFHHLQQQQPRLQKANNSTVPSPHSLEYPITTPSSIMSTPEPATRQRLEDRIALLMKQPNCVLSTIVAPVAPQASPTYSAFSLTSDTSYYHHPYPPQPASIGLYNNDKHRTELYNRYQRKPDNNNHHHQGNHHNHRNHDKANNKSGHYSSEHNSDDEMTPKEVKKQLEVELTESQIEDEVLPYSYDKYFDDLSKTLFEKLFKRLRENLGYLCIEEAQAAYRAKKNKEKLEREKERMDKEHYRQLEKRYLSRESRVERPSEAPRPRANFMRHTRIIDDSMMQDTRRHNEAELRRRPNRTAHVSHESERRGSHTTSLASDSSSEDDDSSSSSSLSSRSSSRSSSMSSISSYNERDSRYSSSSRSNSSSISRSISPAGLGEDDRLKGKLSPEPKNENEMEAVDALLSFRNSAPESKQLVEDKLEDRIDILPPKSAGRKRKKQVLDEFGSVASEYRAAKRFASDLSGTLTSYDENTDIAINENFYEEKPEVKFTFSERSTTEKQRLLDDIFGTLDEEDIEFLLKVHQESPFNTSNDLDIPFGSMAANLAHLNMRTSVIEGKAAQSHPKWWRGCSRCDVIKNSEKHRVQDEDENEGETENTMKIGEIANRKIKACTARRDQRGNQRRLAVQNPDLEIDLIRMVSASTLQMRSKNLRFSKSKIHKWGLFACEDIGPGDAVIEYVGEKIRPSVADHREKVVYAELPGHDGSSYFFRVDFDVIDATLKGNKARFINHSCNPNCFAKVIKHDNGSNSIVIYAKQNIKENEEITYDYKFPREEGVDKIVCNCGAPNCQKHLN